MDFFTNIFSVLGIPMGWVLGWLYKGVGNYFGALFLFTLLMRMVTFPISLKSQKSQADRIKLAPRLERLQKKYGQDRQKMQQKQQELYEKEGVSMAAGCLPSVIQMVLLFAMIAVIYAPLTSLSGIPKDAVAIITNASVEGKDANAQKKDKSYIELKALQRLDNAGQREKLFAALTAEKDGKPMYTAVEVNKYLDKMQHMLNRDFKLGGAINLLDYPNKGFGWLWLLPIISGLTSLATSWLMSFYQKRGTSGEKQPGQGCMTVMTLLLMPGFSLYITFTVPGAVGLYWIFSNVIAIAQTVILNKIYDPRKIREQAVIDDEERRRRRAEDKKKLKSAGKPSGADLSGADSSGDTASLPADEEN